jgi:cyclopropane-fatty-acyl-phospholipid synthase
MVLDPERDAALRSQGKSHHRGLAASILGRIAGQLEAGRLAIEAPSGPIIDHRSGIAGPEAVLQIRNWRFAWRLISAGDVGVARSYLEGDWTSPDLTALLELAALNMEKLERAITGSTAFRVINRMRHLFNANTRTGSRRNIAFHYDLGNEFYRLWLDESMTYSAALYDRADDTLESAQQRKRERIVALLEPGKGERILEIGSGWGALAMRLAERAEVVGLTLSSEQLAYATELARRNGLSPRLSFELSDYRDVEGTFDKIVSVEMLEAVGERYWPAYFSALRQRLKAGGRAVLQAITIDEDRFEAYRRSPDFIQRYIFPGGMLPTKSILASQAEQAGLKLIASEHFGQSYALTLAEWRQRFWRARADVERLGFDERFMRMWECYLSYCEAGFRAGSIDVGAYVLE